MERGVEPGFGEPPLWLLLKEETHISFSFKLGQSWPRLCFLFIQLPLSGVCPHALSFALP